ncbi:MAG TPA: hypothetical protein VJ350_01890 [Methanoregula sp.]|nr:hypothetical protein [Methanoregula sp.]
MYVESGDSIALAAGIIIVLFVAVMAHPEYLAALQIPFSVEVPAAIPQIRISAEPTPVPQVQIPIIPALPGSRGSLYRITYTDKPYSYPLYILPNNMETFGASELPAKTLEWVPFAFVEDTRGGLTEVFSVPYPVWVINSTVVAKTRPQYSVFRMVLCSAESGEIVEGEEILNRGTSYRIVQTSNTGMYMVISTENIDRFYIRLETPRNYYDAYRPVGS